MADNLAGLRGLVEKLKDMLAQPVNNWIVDGNGIFYADGSGPLIRDDIAHPQSIALIAEALNFTVKKLAIQELAAELNTFLTANKQGQGPLTTVQVHSAFIKQGYTFGHGLEEVTADLNAPLAQTPSGEDAWLDEFEAATCYGVRDKLRTCLRAYRANLLAQNANVAKNARKLALEEAAQHYDKEAIEADSRRSDQTTQFYREVADAIRALADRAGEK